MLKYIYSVQSYSQWGKAIFIVNHQQVPAGTTIHTLHKRRSIMRMIRWPPTQVAQHLVMPLIHIMKERVQHTLFSCEKCLAICTIALSAIKAEAIQEKKNTEILEISSEVANCTLSSHQNCCVHLQLQERGC